MICQKVSYISSLSKQVNPMPNTYILQLQSQINLMSFKQQPQKACNGKNSIKEQKKANLFPAPTNKHARSPPLNKMTKEYTLETQIQSSNHYNLQVIQNKQKLYFFIAYHFLPQICLNNILCFGMKQLCRIWITVDTVIQNKKYQKNSLRMKLLGTAASITKEFLFLKTLFRQKPWYQRQVYQLKS
eukprot:TRINITY_DN14065_c1_g1_i2.p2 TRINITY_DN14065_c1_g1~~TRINITY_DN14065_c1_g1_i2.p2  ORF type:complete len:186 (-),score=-6.85 TRINITY_DN14065_c1_g1_i2:376-933(-)